MKTRKNLLVTLMGTTIVFGLMSFAGFQSKPWAVPAEYKTKANPVKSSAATIGEGKELWGKSCASCHGKTGLGDGPKAKLLETPAGDFSSKAFQAQTDGELFYKTWKGRGEMPGFKGKVSDDEIWKMVVFMRTMKK